jgi:hypothetical protein
MECQRDKTIEPAGLVLEFPQAHEMIDAFLKRLDMAVEHGGVRTNTHVVYRAGDFQPSGSGNLMPGNQRPGALGENFRATTGTASHSGIA